MGRTATMPVPENNPVARELHSAIQRVERDLSELRIAYNAALNNYGNGAGMTASGVERVIPHQTGNPPLTTPTTRQPMSLAHRQKLSRIAKARMAAKKTVAAKTMTAGG